ncbi:MAG: hypothetical protein IKJ00_05625 [Clostridia bacterium]|nr:hypothetical protein [Clostridia bacterium]
MKKINRHMAALLSLIMVITSIMVCIPTFAATYEGGLGTEQAPYEIATAEQLAALASEVNGGKNQAGVYFKLTADIAINETSDWESWSSSNAPQNTWTPIGNNTNTFAGTFDGNGKTVSGIYISSTTGYIGLFGGVSGTVKNLTVDKSYIYSSANYVGGITGVVTGTVENCINYATIEGGDIGDGGIAGNCEGGTLTKCANYGKISGTQYVAGIIGRLIGNVSQCLNEGEISGTQYIGGIAGITGKTNPGIVSNCINLGEVMSSKDSAGGIVGRYGNANSCDISDCINIGAVSAASLNGAIFGSSKSGNSVTVSNNYYDSNTSSAPSYGANNSGVADATGYTTEELKGVGIVSKLKLDTKYWMNTENGYPVLKALTAFDTSYTGYQFTEFSEGYCDLRFIGVVNDKDGDGSLDDEYLAVGFEIEMTSPKAWNNKISDGKAPSITTVYTSVMEGGKAEATDAYELCGDYIFVTSVRGIKQGVGEVTFTVKVFHDELDGERVYDDSYVITYDTGSANAS